MPNVQYDNAQLRSATPGEIDPANISISGGLHYQNNFQLDGFNMNNDLDPIGGSQAGNGGSSQGLRSGRSQGLNIDTSLLESITVQDSNVSAAYGRFTGGVIEANVRKARKDGFHANISYQHTSDKFTQYFIHESAEQAFATSSNENYQPHFTKHLIRANVEGYVKENLGLIAAFSTTRSYIPLNAYAVDRFTLPSLDNPKREQKRISDNYYLKAHYNPIESFTLEANIAYIPQNNTFFNNLAKDSYNTMKSGGYQGGLKALWDTDTGLWTNTLGYSRLQNSRDSESNFYRWWYPNNTTKNWATIIGSAPYIYEGGYGDIEQLQNTLNFKSDMEFKPLELSSSTHHFRIGADLAYQDVSQNRLGNTYSVNGAPQTAVNIPTNCGIDSFGLETCVVGQVNRNNVAYAAQYASGIVAYGGGKINLNNTSYGLYAEDDIKLDLKNVGEINTRFGLRLDGDNYMDKHTLAPRFSLNYITPVAKEWQSSIIFGANRYYGRNLFSYRLLDSTLSQQQRYTRNLNADVLSEWRANTTGTTSFRFDKLNVPYDDELMVGITQNLGNVLNATLKYINRQGKDEIMRRQRSAASGNAPALDGYTASYNFYTNDGSSKSDIITFTLSNASPIDTFSLKHYYLLAFDWTNTKRSYNVLSSDEAYINNQDIMYDGKIIKYQDRPVDNYTRPYTIRLNTTHSFNIAKTKWLLNNFFRYRAGYESMVQLNRTSAGYDPTFSGTQYGKMKFSGAFSWDMRVGFEVDVYKKNTMYVNLDIYNVLNKKNMTTMGLAAGGTLQGVATAASIPVYEVGRQFWLQVGYKY